MDGESSYDDEIDPVTKERIQQQQLMELDRKYLLDDDKLVADNVFIQRANKNKGGIGNQRNGSILEAFSSPFIPPKSADSDQTRNISSATSNNATTVLEEP